MLDEKVRVILRKVLHPMLSISIELTNDCNLDCWYCYRKDRSIGYIDIEKYKILMTQLPITCIGVALSFAGESGLHPKIAEFVEIAHKHGFTPKIYSNGTLKYPEGAKVIKYPKPPEVIYTNNFKFLKNYNLPNTYETCPEIYSSMNVLWNGDVVPCCKDLGGKHIMGSAFADGLMNVWNGKKYKELRKAGHCIDCEIYKYKQRLSYIADKYTEES